MKLLLTFVFFALCPLLASATTITSGTITLPYDFGSRTFDFSGAGFSVSGAFGGGGGGAWSYGGPCNPCTPTNSAMVTGIIIGNDLGDGSATVDGTNLGSIKWGDLFALRGTTLSTVGPNIAIDAGPGTYHGTFSFSGTMCGTNGTGSEPRPCIVDLPNLTGSGTVDITVGPNQLYENMVYTFVTPEPQTWTLALIGIVAIVGWRLKATRRGTTNLS